MLLSSMILIHHSYEPADLRIAVAFCVEVAVLSVLMPYLHGLPSVVRPCLFVKRVSYCLIELLAVLEVFVEGCHNERYLVLCWPSLRALTRDVAELPNNGVW